MEIVPLFFVRLEVLTASVRIADALRTCLGHQRPVGQSAHCSPFGAPFVTLLSVFMLALPRAGATAPVDKTAVTMKGEEAFRLLVGNTLRSTAASMEPTPTYRYFRNDHLEYRCGGGKLAAKSPKELNIVRWTVGCAIFSIALKEGHLCESYFGETCQDDEFALIFRRKPTPVAKDGQILGHVTIHILAARKRKSTDHKPFKGEFDLIKGNATLFPDFDPQPKPELLRPLDRPEDVGDEERRCIEGDTLGPQKALKEISGNTLVSYDRNGKFDGRSAEYFGPDGRIVGIGIPSPVPAASKLAPTGDQVSGIGINLWKIKNGYLCRTENDAPSEFVCSFLVNIQKPKLGDAQAEPRLCVSGQPVQFIIKGNPFAVDFSRVMGK